MRVLRRSRAPEDKCNGGNSQAVVLHIILLHYGEAVKNNLELGQRNPTVGTVCGDTGGHHAARRTNVRSTFGKVARRGLSLLQDYGTSLWQLSREARRFLMRPEGAPMALPDGLRWPLGSSRSSRFSVGVSANRGEPAARLCAIERRPGADAFLSLRTNPAAPRLRAAGGNVRC